MKKRKDILNQVFVHLKDLTREELTSIPKKADTLYDITDDIMRNGVYIYKDTTAYYIPPDSIIKIEYVKGKCKDCDGKEPCDYCDDDEEEDDA